MLADGQSTKWRRNIAEKFNQLSKVHNVTDDGRARAYSKPRTLKTIVKCITRMIRPVDGPGTMYLTNIHTLQVLRCTVY